MLDANQVTNYQSAVYATGTDFCRIFEDHMDRLYLLSLLLTADSAVAERCFVQGLADTRTSNSVFKEWAESWARRTIIQNAIQVLQPRPDDEGRVAGEMAVDGISLPAELSAIVELPTFDRFAYVISVLEHYSLQECSLLLGCSRSEVIAARMRALQQVVWSAKRKQKLALLAATASNLDTHAHLAATA